MAEGVERSIVMGVLSGLLFAVVAVSGVLFVMREKRVKRVKASRKNVRGVDSFRLCLGLGGME